MAFFTDSVMPWLDRYNPFITEDATALSNPNMPVTADEAAQIGMLMARANQSQNGEPAPIPNSGMFGAVPPGGVMPSFVQTGRPQFAEDFPIAPGSDFDPNKPLPVKTTSVPGVPAGQSPFAPIEASPQEARGAPAQAMPQPVPPMQGQGQDQGQGQGQAATPGANPNWPYNGQPQRGASRGEHPDLLTRIAQSTGLVPKSDAGGGPDFSPSFGERLMAVGAALNGQQSSDLNAVAANRNATYRALIGRGVDPATAEAAVRNPAMLQTVLGNAFQHRKWGQIGTDVLGNPQYGFIDEQRGTVTPASPGGAGAGGGDTGGIDHAFDQITKALAPKNGEKGEDYLSQQNPILANKARNIMAGREVMPKATRGDRTALAVQAMVRYADPTYTENRPNYLKQWQSTSNKTTGFVRIANNAALTHTGSLSDLVQSAPNVQAGPLSHMSNRVVNWWKYESNDPWLNEWKATSTALADEITRVLTGTAGALADREKILATLDPSLGQPALNATLKQYAHLLAAKTNALANDWKRNMGPFADQPEVIDEGNKDILRALEERYGRGNVSEYLPVGGNKAQNVDDVLHELRTGMSRETANRAHEERAAGQAQPKPAAQSGQASGRDQAGVELPGELPTDARLAPDGNYYIYRNGKYYRWK